MSKWGSALLFRFRIRIHKGQHREAKCVQWRHLVDRDQHPPLTRWLFCLNCASIYYQEQDILVGALVAMGIHKHYDKRSSSMWYNKLLWVKCACKYQHKGDNLISILSYSEADWCPPPGRAIHHHRDVGRCALFYGWYKGTHKITVTPTKKGLQHKLSTNRSWC